MEQYTILSRFYDGLMTDFPYQKYCDYILSLCKSGKGVDLFCGSGKMTILLSQAGLNMIGIDASSEMLKIAEKNSHVANEKIIYALGNAEKVELPSNLDLVTAICDGVNYVNDRALVKIFSNVAKSIKKGGYFVFDMSTEYKLTTIIGNNIFYEDYDEYTYFWRNKVKNDHIDMDLTFFIKENDKYTRADESQRQYIHNIERIELLLKECGLNLVNEMDGDKFDKVTKKSKRIIFTVRKA